MKKSFIILNTRADIRFFCFKPSAETATSTYFEIKDCDEILVHGKPFIYI